MAAYLKTKIPLGEKIILEPGFRLNSYSEGNLRLFPDFRLGNHDIAINLFPSTALFFFPKDSAIRIKNPVI